MHELSVHIFAHPILSLFGMFCIGIFFLNWYFSISSYKNEKPLVLGSVDKLDKYMLPLWGVFMLLYFGPICYFLFTLYFFNNTAPFVWLEKFGQEHYMTICGVFFFTWLAAGMGVGASGNNQDGSRR